MINLISYFIQTVHAVSVDTIFSATPETPLPDFFSSLYTFSITISGFLAFGMIVFGGIYSIFFAITPDKKIEGKNMIFGALWGLFLLLGSYVILKNINPQLVQLKNPGEAVLQNVQYDDCRPPQKKEGGSGVQVTPQLPFCELYQNPRDTNTGKCVCYITDQWIAEYNNQQPDNSEDTGAPTLQGCENPYKSVCAKYGGSYKESVALECKALGKKELSGLIKSDYGWWVNSTVNESYKKAMECVAQKYPEWKNKFYFRTGWRSPEEQYNTYKTKGPSQAAKPCCSNHGSGCALDINRKDGEKMTWAVSNGILKECMNTFGLKAEVTISRCPDGPGECWHFSPSGH